MGEDASLTEPEVYGTGFIRFSFAEEQLVIHVSRIREHSDSTTCELEIRTWDGTHLHWGKLNLEAPSSRTKLAKDLSARSVNQKAWESILERVVTRTIRHIRKGEPVMTITSEGEIAPVEYLIFPFLPKGQPTIICGREGAGKSLAVLALAIVAELPWIENPLGLVAPADSMKALYVDYETSEETMKRRLQTLVRGFELPYLDIDYLHATRPLVDDIDRLQEILHERKVKFLIIDSLGAAAGAELNSPEAAQNIFLHGVRQLQDVTTLIVAHPSKAEEGKKTVYGTVFFQAYARSVWLLEKTQQVNRTTFDIAIRHEKANDSMLFPSMHYQFEFGDDWTRMTRKRAEETEGGWESMSNMDKVRHVLSRYGAMSYKELQDETGLTLGALRVATGRLQKDGWATKIDDQKWGLLRRLDD